MFTKTREAGSDCGACRRPAETTESAEILCRPRNLAAVSMTFNKGVRSSTWRCRGRFPTSTSLPPTSPTPPHPFPGHNCLQIVGFQSKSFPSFYGYIILFLSFIHLVNFPLSFWICSLNQNIMICS